MVCSKCGKKMWIWDEKKVGNNVFCKKCYEAIKAQENVSISEPHQENYIKQDNVEPATPVKPEYVLTESDIELLKKDWNQAVDQITQRIDELAKSHRDKLQQTLSFCFNFLEKNLVGKRCRIKRPQVDWWTVIDRVTSIKRSEGIHGEICSIWGRSPENENSHIRAVSIYPDSELEILD